MAQKAVSFRSKAMKLEGVPQLVKTLQALGSTLSGQEKGAFDDRVRDAMLKPAEIIADEARDMAPVVTGALRASIHAFKLTKQVGAIVKTIDVRYAAMVEFGTSKTSAHPYFRPAINAVRPLAANVVGEELSKVITDMTKQGAWHQTDGAA